MSIKDWSTTATGNASVAGINFSEGQAPSTVNNSARELMAQVRSEYQFNRWGWVAHSASASVATQTTVVVAGDITGQAVINRKIKLTGGSTEVIGTIVSASYTTETTITLTDASGSLSASHAVVWLSAAYGDNIPANVVTGSGTTTLSAAIILGSASFSGSAHFTGPVDIKGAMSVSGEAAFHASASFSASVKFEGAVIHNGAVNFNGGGVVASATLSVAAGMLTVGGSAVTGGGSNSGFQTFGASSFSGSWSAISVFMGGVASSIATSAGTGTSQTASVGVYTDGGTTPVLSGKYASTRMAGSGNATTSYRFEIRGNGTNQISLIGIYAGVNPTATVNAVGGEVTLTTTTSSGPFWVNCIKSDIGGGPAANSFLVGN